MGAEGAEGGVELVDVERVVVHFFIALESIRINLKKIIK